MLQSFFQVFSNHFGMCYTYPSGFEGYRCKHIIHSYCGNICEFDFPYTLYTYLYVRFALCTPNIFVHRAYRAHVYIYIIVHVHVIYSCSIHIMSIYDVFHLKILYNVIMYPVSFHGISTCFHPINQVHGPLGS